MDEYRRAMRAVDLKEPPMPALVKLEACPRVVTHYYAMVGPTIRKTTSDWEQVQAFVVLHPKAVVTVQYEIFSPILPVDVGLEGSEAWE